MAAEDHALNTQAELAGEQEQKGRWGSVRLTCVTAIELLDGTKVGLCKRQIGSRQSHPAWCIHAAHRPTQVRSPQLLPRPGAGQWCTA